MAHISFWDDEWVDGIILKRAFPRIYVMAIKKVESIDEFGEWVDYAWTRRINLRKDVLG